MLRILLADDHELTRSGLRYLLEKHEEWSVCGEASNGRMAVEMAENLRPDVAILDMSMPELNGLETTRQILKKQPQLKILIFTMHETERVIVDVLEAGARGVVLKSDIGENMVAAIESISKGRRFFTSRVAETVVDAYLSKRLDGEKEETSSQFILTTREREVVQLLAEGKSNKEVADRLGISARTAEGHRSEIMRKLKLGSLADLVRFAIRNGIVQA
ncbi:MAG: response regulator transcription factor [Candidatus Korobacteraceae bacterium]